MKVKELIKKLQKLDPETEVMQWVDPLGYNPVELSDELDEVIHNPYGHIDGGDYLKPENIKNFIELAEEFDPEDGKRWKKLLKNGKRIKVVVI